MPLLWRPHCLHPGVSFILEGFHNTHTQTHTNTHSNKHTAQHCALYCTGRQNCPFGWGAYKQSRLYDHGLHSLHKAILIGLCFSTISNLNHLFSLAHSCMYMDCIHMPRTFPSTQAYTTLPSQPFSAIGQKEPKVLQHLLGESGWLGGQEVVERGDTYSVWSRFSHTNIWQWPENQVHTLSRGYSLTRFRRLSVSDAFLTYWKNSVWFRFRSFLRLWNIIFFLFCAWCMIEMSSTLALNLYYIYLPPRAVL